MLEGSLQEDIAGHDFSFMSDRPKTLGTTERSLQLNIY